MISLGMPGSKPRSSSSSKQTAAQSAGKPAKRTRSRKTQPKKSKGTPRRVKVKGSQTAGDLLLRDLDPEVVRVLKVRAERAGRSLQQELHSALRRDTKRNFDEAVAISSSWRERLKDRDLPDSTELLREDRGR